MIYQGNKKLAPESRFCQDKIAAEQLASTQQTKMLPQTVPEDLLRRHWSVIAQQTSDPRAGIFGPSSVSWTVNRESALFLGAGRAARPALQSSR
jgi:hypothetical protein